MKRFQYLVTACILSIMAIHTTTVTFGEEKNNTTEQKPLVQKADIPQVVSSIEEYNQQMIPLLFEDTQKKVSLYGLKNKGLILYYQNEAGYFDVEYQNAKFQLPTLLFGDYNNDKKEEIALLATTDKDSDLSQSLHIISTKKYVNEPRIFTDHYYNPKDYTKQIKDAIQYTYNKTDKILMVFVGNKNVECDLSKYIADGQSIEGLDFDCSAKFVVDEEKDLIFGNFLVGVKINGVEGAVRSVPITAKVNFNDETGFRLTSINYGEYKLDKK